MELLLSVIVPVYNVEKYLPKCLESIIKQTYKNLEIILIDDGSTDDSGKICDEYAEKDKRIKVVHQKNQGVSVARNKGLDLCTGDYITFVDSDDWCEVNYFEQIFACNSIDKNIGIIITNFVKEYKNGQSKLMYKTSCKRSFDRYNALKNMIKGNLYGWEVYSTFYKRENTRNIRFATDINYGEDFGFKWNVIRNSSCKILYLPIKGYYYIWRDNSAVNSYNIESKIISLKLQERMIKQESEVEYRQLLIIKYLNAILYYFEECCLHNIDNNILKEKINRNIGKINLLKNFTICIRYIMTFLPNKIRRYLMTLNRFRK